MMKEEKKKQTKKSGKKKNDKQTTTTVPEEEHEISIFVLFHSDSRAWIVDDKSILFVWRSGHHEPA